MEEQQTLQEKYMEAKAIGDEMRARFMSQVDANNLLQNMLNKVQTELTRQEALNVMMSEQVQAAKADLQAIVTGINDSKQADAQEIQRLRTRLKSYTDLDS